MADHQTEATFPIAKQEQLQPSSKASLSCIPYADALWFCYSPVFQMKQYYREGTFDSCTGKWGELFSCISLKTKSSSEVEAILKEREAEKEKTHLWQFRTVEEARVHWNEQFGHLQD